MKFPVLFSLVAAAAVVLPSRPASAFCRTRTCEFSTQDCRTDTQGCSTQGVPAQWGSGCIPFAIQVDGSVAQGISADEVGALVRDGFQVWTDADCGEGNTPELRGVDRGNIECDQVEFNCEAGTENNNIVLFRDGPSDLPSQTIALSTIIANLTTGEILDVDIEMNSYRHTFNGTGDDPVDLAVVINHELGHLLGLSHSRDPDSLMRVAYGAEPLLGADDEAGICASYPFGDEDPQCADILALGEDAQCSGAFTDCRLETPVTETNGCSVSPARSGGRNGWFAWGCLLVGLAGATRRLGGSNRG